MTTITHPPETNFGVVTSWLPVPTAWPSVEQCSSAIYSQYGSGGVAIAFDPYYGLNIDQELTCLPPDVTSWWDQKTQTPVQTVTSLGPLVCPGLYTTALSSALNSLSTFIACCPSEYAFQTVTYPLGECNSPLSVSQAFTYASLNSTLFAWEIATTTISAAGASVFAIPVNGYVFAASAASSTTTTSTSATSSSTTTPQSTSGLSTGAKAGIGVGAVALVIGICSLLLALYYIRRYKKGALNRDARRVEPDPAFATYSSPSESSWKNQPPQELDPQHYKPVPVYEMSAVPK